jgi:hypothetical protein
VRQTNNGIPSIPALTGPRVWRSVAGDHDPTGALMIRPVIAALPALAAPAPLVVPAACADALS